MTLAIVKTDEPAATETPLDEGRERLRIAISGHQGIVAQIQTLVEAIERARETANAADAAVEGAQAAVGEARERDIKETAVAARKGKTAKGGRLKAARAALLDAQDEAELAHEVTEKLREELAALEPERIFAEAEVIRCRNVLIEPLLEQVSTRYLASSAQMVRDGLLLRALTESLDQTPKGVERLHTVDRLRVTEALRASVPDTNEVIASQCRTPDDFYEQRAATFERIQESLSGLLSNPNGELPQI